MSKFYTLIIASIFIIASLISCNKIPEYSNTPQIVYEGIEYIQHDLPQSDSVIIKIMFKDGDADLGLEDADSSAPYHEVDFLRDSNGNLIFLDDPANYNPYEYTITANDDTLRSERNEFHFNYYVEFHQKVGNTFVLLTDSVQCIDFGNCIPFHGRFERLNKKDFTNEIYVGPLEGDIQFTMTSVNFYPGEYKFIIYIYDRALNKSNVVETAVIDFQ